MSPEAIEDRIALLASGLPPDPASGVPAPDRAMLAYALALTRNPGGDASDAVARLREQGFDDRGIHDICGITAYYAFVNRIADGLGVELEEIRPHE